TIAYNNSTGVNLQSATSTGNAIQGNSVYHNDRLGIDLGGDGVTPNDWYSHSSGPNFWQNYPVLLAAYAGASTVVMGTLNSTPSRTFTVDFYANDADKGSATSYGQGQYYLGSKTVCTDASGSASFTAIGLTAAGLGQWVSATATSPTGDTSEFSQDVQV